MTTARSTLAFVGGTGKQGRGLALRFAAAGHPVLIGSRVDDRAAEAAAKLRERLEHFRRRLPPRLEGMRNDAAVDAAGIVFLTVPYAGLDAFLHERGALLAGKIVIDVVNPLALVDGRFVLTRVAESSVSARIARVASGARVVAGFKNAAAAHLLALDTPALGDVLLASDDADAKATVADLVREIPDLRPLDSGPLANAEFLEAITALELNLNRIHDATTTIRILGV